LRMTTGPRTMTGLKIKAKRKTLISVTLAMTLQGRPLDVYYTRAAHSHGLRGQRSMGNERVYFPNLKNSNTP